ncbi:MAG: ankyrin repeat domain-containing protein [Gammaproteobacteria bacterium]|nr:ankyrin repeat domain-containing protein [Gammaproteobacteria bacterium]
MIKKVLAALVIIIPVSWIGFTVYALTTFNLETLMIYSTHGDACRIPHCESVVEYYTLHFRGTKQDIADLEQGAGLSFVFGDSETRSKFLNFLIEKGINVNKISPIDGATPLHGAVLFNDPELVKFLLDHGADPNMRKEKNVNSLPEYDNLTPLELVDVMSRNKPEIDRSKVKQILVAHAKLETPTP